MCSAYADESEWTTLPSGSDGRHVREHFPVLALEHADPEDLLEVCVERLVAAGEVDDFLGREVKRGGKDGEQGKSGDSDALADHVYILLCDRTPKAMWPHELAAVVPDTGGVADSVSAFSAGRYLPGGAPGRRPGGFHFQPSFNMAAGADGYFATEGDSYSIEAYDAGGRLVRIIRLAREPRPVTDAVKAVNEDGIRDRIRGYVTGSKAAPPKKCFSVRSPLPTPRVSPHSSGSMWTRKGTSGRVRRRTTGVVRTSSSSSRRTAGTSASSWCPRISRCCKSGPISSSLT